MSAGNFRSRQFFIYTLVECPGLGLAPDKGRDVGREARREVLRSTAEAAEREPARAVPTRPELLVEAVLFTLVVLRGKKG